MNNYAEFFPILKYENGKLTRVNGSKRLLGGDFTRLPLFSLKPKTDLELRLDVTVNGLNITSSIHSLNTSGQFFKDLPDPCFLVAVRKFYGYTIEEMTSLNKIWDNLMSKL